MLSPMIVIAALAVSANPPATLNNELPAEIARLMSQADHTAVVGRSADGDQISYRASWRRIPRAINSAEDSSGGAAGAQACTDFQATFHAVGSTPEGDHPTCAAYTPDGATVLLGHRDSNNLIRYDADTHEFLSAIELSGSPQDLAITPDGTRAITANIDTETVSIIDLATNTEIATVAAGTMAGVVEITADGTRAIVGNPGESSISIIDIASATEVLRIADTGFTMSVTYAPESGAVAVDFSRFAVLGNDTIIHPSSYDDQILFIDIATGNITSHASEDWPREIDVSPDGTTAIVSHYNNPWVSVLDPVAGTIDRTIAMGENTWGPVVLSADGAKAAVAVLNAVRIVDLSDDSISASLNTATVYGLERTADGLYALGIGYRGSLMSFDSEMLLVNTNQVISTPVGAVSPVHPHATLAANVFGEDMVFVSTDGALAGVLEVRPSGPDPEGDICRTSAVNSKTGRVVTANLFSRTAEVFDSSAGVLLERFDTGSRPSDVQISSDGSTALIANLDSSFATIIDLNTLTASEVSISTRASRSQISPDGTYAYVAVVSGGDGVWRINLNSMTTEGPKLITGNMGSVGYAYSRTSDLVLSHDGATLITCDSFDDTITIIDTASWSVAATVAMGDFPTLATFSPDDSHLYVSLLNDDAVAVVNVALGSVLDTIAVGDRPGPLLAAPDEDTLFVLNTNQHTLGVIDLNLGTMITELAMPYNAVGMAMDPTGSCLYIGTGTATTSVGGTGYSFTQDGALVVVDTATLAISSTIATGVGAGDLAHDSSGSLMAIASPSGDGVVILSEGGDIPGDLNGDGLVNGADLGLLLVLFGSNDPTADFNGDGVVDGADLGLFLVFWSP